ncbi:VCBS repeat-containing protein [Streptomyces venezuelae]|uniref:FG-GAP repeat domain-containing protein n=1 Tax=Streptomyces venezuelae TaxID=54571 RepID=UPI001238D069|nr:VCBS repeat-containing protein [Streptomyces venezuelae]QES06926.1 VCBS repeat-containing protein [Streptomyces venezuelae]
MVRTFRRHQRLASALAVTLAVTAGAGAAAPASAAPASVPSAAPAAVAEEAGPVVVSPDARLLGTGSSGYLSRVADGDRRTYSWTRYADGATTVLPPSPYYRGSSTGDLVVALDGSGHQSGYRVLDMAAGGAPTVIDTSFLGPTATLVAPVGDALLLSTAEGSGEALHLVSRSGGEVVHHEITGLPADATKVSTGLTAPGVLAVRYTGTVGGTTGQRLAVVDLATAKAVDDRAVPDNAASGAASATHVAWVERLSDQRSVVVTARRGSATTSRYELPAQSGAITLHLLDGWVTYTVAGGRTAEAPNPLHPLTALSLQDNRTTVKLLDSTEMNFGALVQGGTLANGEGFYRIGVGVDGRPAATMVATSKVSTALAEVRYEGPGTVDFSRSGTWATFRWFLNRPQARVDVTLVHRRTGKSWHETLGPYDWTGGFAASWNGEFRNVSAALNGEYTVSFTARPENGIGPVLTRSATFRVDNGTAPHDYSDKGSPDLLARTSAGRLISYDVNQVRSERMIDWVPTDRGGGWNIYDRLVATGDLAGSQYADLVARDRTGVLWFYQGTGPSLARRTAVGGGWQVYDQLAAGSDLTGDGRPDLLATDKSGGLWFYKATGDTAKPFAPRKRLGGGWGGYDKLVATGDIGGAPAGDLLARDRAGVLWLYLGKGDGTFAPRTKVGGGWQRYSDIVAVGDATKDGRPDLLVRDASPVTMDSLGFYPGTGDWKAPFSSRRQLYSQGPLEELDPTLF